MPLDWILGYACHMLQDIFIDFLDTKKKKKKKTWHLLFSSYVHNACSEFKPCVKWKLVRELQAGKDLAIMLKSCAFQSLILCNAPSGAEKGIAVDNDLSWETYHVKCSKHTNSIRWVRGIDPECICPISQRCIHRRGCI